VLPRQPRGHRGGEEETPSEAESSGDKEEEEDEITPSPHSLPLKTSAHLVTSSASKRGSLLVLVR
jgi:hypothetical protein